MNKGLSVIIITKNEEERIERCLESVKWADEIVIVDDMSTDKTLQLCKIYTNKIIQNKSDGNFDRQRNIGIENASGDWILQMDADEIVPPGFSDEIKDTVSSESCNFNGFYIMRKNFFLGHFMRFGGWYHKSLKLFRKDSARYIGESIHETLDIKGKIGLLKEPIEHYPFSSFEEFIKRQNFYTSYEARLLLKKRNSITDKEITYNLCSKPIKLFLKTFLKKQGFRDGFYGFIFSVLYSWVYFLKWAKYVELIKQEESRK